MLDFVHRRFALTQGVLERFQRHIKPILLRYLKQSATVLAGSRIRTGTPSIRCVRTPALNVASE